MSIKAKNCYFSWLPHQRPLSGWQMNAEFIEPLQSSTKPENLVKIRSVVPQIFLLLGRPLKITKKPRQNI